MTTPPTTAALIAATRDATEADKDSRFALALARAGGNAARLCSSCGHWWHGLACGKTGCACPTAWVEPEIEGEIA